MANREITLVEVAAVPTLVVAATSTWARFPTLWPELSGEVWACLRAGGVVGGSPNVMLYLDDRPRVEVGVVWSAAVPLTGRVRRSTLPAGRVARTVHRGRYSGLAATHRALLDWCASSELRPTQTRWEIYGPHRDDPDQLRVEVCWLVRTQSAVSPPLSP